MASKFWVGGSGNWSDTTHWATSSGGVGSTGVPVAADSITTDAASNATAYTITIDTAAVGKTFTFGDPASGTLSIVTDANKTRALTLSGNVSFAAAANIQANSVTNRLLIQSSLPGTTRTLTSTSTGTFANVDFMDVAAAGVTPFTGTSLGDCLGNSNITFTAAAPQYWRTTTTGTKTWSTAANWFLGTNGTGGAGRVPLPQDNAIFDASSIGAASTTVSGDMPRLGKDITWTGVTNTPTWQSSVLWSSYGSVTLVSGMTFNCHHGWAFCGRGSHAITSAGKTFVTAIWWNAYGGTYTLADAAIFSTYALLVYGTFTATGNVTIGTNLVMSAGTPWNLNMGSGTWTLPSMSVNTGSSSTVNCNSAIIVFTGAGMGLQAAVTWNAGTSLLKYTDSSSTTKTLAVTGAGKTFNSVWLSGAGSGSFNFTGSNIINDFKIDGGAKTIKFTAATNTTVASMTGFEGNVATFDTVSGAGTFTITKTGGGVVRMRGANVTRSTAMPANTFYAGATGVDGGSNTNWLFQDAPSEGGGGGWAAPRYRQKTENDEALLIALLM